MKCGLALVVIFLAACLDGFGSEDSAARPFLHSLFSDHVVLQRGLPVPVWGWTEPGAKVRVRFAGQTREAKADTDGRWEVRLKPMLASNKPRTLTVLRSDHSQTVTVRDVLGGDVWICSGQSNMEMGVGACNVPDDIYSANYPNIRLLTVPRLIANRPVQTLQAAWLPCYPTNLMQGLWAGFSAAGYFFGREIHRELNVPIGLIHASWGGTPVEAWTSFEGLKPMAGFNERLEQDHRDCQRTEGKRPGSDAESGRMVPNQRPRNG